MQKDFGDEELLILYEVTRVALEVGNQGKLGSQADVKGVDGIWKDLTNNVNLCNKFNGTTQSHFSTTL